MKPKIGDRISVYWLDAHSHDAWTPAKDAQMLPVEIETLGILFESTKTHITVVQNIDRENHAVSSIMCIPRKMMTSIRKLK